MGFSSGRYWQRCCPGAQLGEGAETQEGNHGTEARTEIQILPAEGEEKKAANADQETADT